MLPEQRELAKMALRNAQECLDICLHADSYRWAFTYAVHYTRASSRGVVLFGRRAAAL